MTDTPEKIAAEIQDIGSEASSMIGAKAPRAFPRGESRTVEPEWAIATLERCFDLAERVCALPAWSPIEDAPFDGTPFVAITEGGDCVVAVIERLILKDGEHAPELRLRGAHGVGILRCIRREGRVFAFCKAISVAPPSWELGYCWEYSPSGPPSDPPEWWIELLGGARR